MKNRITLIPLVAIALTVGSASADPTAVKLSSLDRSIFFRDGKGTRGKAGFNGGHYSDKVFDGNFTNYAYQNAAGAELVILSTTRPRRNRRPFFPMLRTPAVGRKSMEPPTSLSPG